MCLGLAAGALHFALQRAPKAAQEEKPGDVQGVASVASAAGLARSTDIELSPHPLEDEARRRLERYRSSDACKLECAGYLDLYGNAWGCLVQGDGWAEVLVIRDSGLDACSVQTIRLEAGP